MSGRVSTKLATRWWARGRSMPAKRMRTWQAMRDFVTLTVTGPCSRIGLDIGVEDVAER